MTAILLSIPKRAHSRSQDSDVHLPVPRYDLNCTRLWQEGCTNTSSQWQVLHEGAIDGGCKNFVEGRGGTREICTV